MPSVDFLMQRDGKSGPVDIRFLITRGGQYVLHERSKLLDFVRTGRAGGDMLPYALFIAGNKLPVEIVRDQDSYGLTGVL